MNFIGQGTDIHKIKRTFKQNEIILGGVKIKSHFKVIAHSDGDVVLHSVSNAILGCIQMGDIGEHFSDQDQKFKNINSEVIIKKSLDLMTTKNQKISNVDLTIICQKIILQKHKKEIKNSLQKLLNCGHINVKATRFEKNTNFIQCETVVLSTTI